MTLNDLMNDPKFTVLTPSLRARQAAGENVDAEITARRVEVRNAILTALVVENDKLLEHYGAAGFADTVLNIQLLGQVFAARMHGATTYDGRLIFYPEAKEAVVGRVHELWSTWDGILKNFDAFLKQLQKTKEFLEKESAGRPRAHETTAG